MVRRGHDVIAAAPDGDAEVRQGLARIGVAFRDLTLERAGLDPLADARSILELVRLFREIQPELVFAYTIKPAIYVSIAARIAGVERRSVMITGLGFTFTERRGLRQRAARIVAMQLFRLALTNDQTIFFQNPDDRNEFEKLGLLPAGARVEIVRGSGVDLELYAPSPLPPDPVRFLFVGRLLKNKGIYEYVEAARRTRLRDPSIAFDVVGWIDANPESVQQSELDAWVREGVVNYHGAVADVRPYLRAAHALVLPSYREGTPRSVLEAMSVGRAVITTDVPGCRETIVDGESGRLVPAKDAAALVAAIRELTDDRGKLEQLAANARTRAEQFYDDRVVAGRMLDVMSL